MRSSAFFPFREVGRKDCLLEQVVDRAAIQNINAFIEAGLTTAGTSRKCSISFRSS
jgi:hypothetical protein